MQSSRTKLVTYSYPFTQNKEILGGKVNCWLFFKNNWMLVCVCACVCFSLCLVFLSTSFLQEEAFTQKS